MTIPADRFLTDGDHVVVAMGEIDMATAPQLWEALSLLIELGHRDVVLDMAGVEFMDSQGIAVIVRAQKELETKGGTVVDPRAAAARAHGAGDHRPGRLGSGRGLTRAGLEPDNLAVSAMVDAPGTCQRSDNIESPPARGLKG